MVAIINIGFCNPYLSRSEFLISWVIMVEKCEEAKLQLCYPIYGLPNILLLVQDGAFLFGELVQDDVPIVFLWNCCFRIGFNKLNSSAF